MNILELKSNFVPIMIEVESAGLPKTGLTDADVSFRFFDAAGGVDSFGVGEYTLAEVDAVNFAGVYLVTEYPREDITTTYPTKSAGLVKLQWFGASIDTASADIRVASELREVRRMHAAAFNRLEFNADEDRWDLYDESDVLVGWFAAQDVNGSGPVIEGTHPVTRLLFIQDPAYVEIF